jgi:hypothetical protein
MNDNNGGLYFIVGALVVIVGIGVFLFNGGHFGRSGGSSHTTSIERSTTVTPGGDTTTTVTREKTP